MGALGAAERNGKGGGDTAASGHRCGLRFDGPTLEEAGHG